MSNAKHQVPVVKRGTFATNENDRSLKCKTKTINTEERDSVSQRRVVKAPSQPSLLHMVESACNGSVRGVDGKSKGSVVYRRPSAVARPSSSSECKSRAFMHSRAGE